MKNLNKLLRNNIDKHRQKKKVSLYAIEKLCKKQHPYGKRICNNENQPNVTNLAEMCILLEISPQEAITLDYGEVQKEIDKLKKS